MTNVRRMARRRSADRIGGGGGGGSIIVRDYRRIRILEPRLLVNSVAEQTSPTSHSGNSSARFWRIVRQGQKVPNGRPSLKLRRDSPRSPRRCERRLEARGLRSR